MNNNTHPEEVSSFSFKQWRKRLYLAPVVAVCLLGVLAANQDSIVAEGARELVRQRMAVERMIWTEKANWEIGKEVLLSQIELRQQEVDSLRADIDQAESEMGEADEKISALAEEETRADNEAQVMTARIEALEVKTLAFLARLPEYVQDKVRPLSQQFPKDPATTKQSVSVRFANIAAVINEVVKANSEIYLTSEVRELADGRSAEVAAFYVGLSQGYFVTADGEVAGIGTSSEAGWTWTPSHQAAEVISTAIDILKNEEPAAFVRLPITID